MLGIQLFILVLFTNILKTTKCIINISHGHVAVFKHNSTPNEISLQRFQQRSRLRAVLASALTIEGAIQQSIPAFEIVKNPAQPLRAAVRLHSARFHLLHRYAGLLQVEDVEADGAEPEVHGRGQTFESAVQFCDYKNSRASNSELLTAEVSVLIAFVSSCRYGNFRTRAIQTIFKQFEVEFLEQSSVYRGCHFPSKIKQISNSDFRYNHSRMMRYEFKSPKQTATMVFYALLYIGLLFGAQFLMVQARVQKHYNVLAVIYSVPFVIMGASVASNQTGQKQNVSNKPRIPVFRAVLKSRELVRNS
ncbi:Hypothetical_protein [Hexamita inflata]|uniref:Hypothetical_protein n=1 Tax=Hexamita inflata TaxID=28002 RepID=A0AA86QDW2_9EUKA|nr:Hypothetical protein HINF_LOCUS44570 [Hexamita inflata]CAI9956928.1 Hypothetical protein HINF_LOCUS44573 [Hexamita inflata]